MKIRIGKADGSYIIHLFYAGTEKGRGVIGNPQHTSGKKAGFFMEKPVVLEAEWPYISVPVCDEESVAVLQDQPCLIGERVLGLNEVLVVDGADTHVGK